MEYEFLHDTITGSAKAQFSFEHQVLGPWLEVEIGQNTEQLRQMLSAVDDIESGVKQDLLLTGKEYSVALSKNDVIIQPNALLNGVEQLPDSLLGEDMDFDQNVSASCGVDDFRTMLISWARFTKK